jgi:acetoacetyl-CoA reductase
MTRVAFVTGGTRGIGEAICKKLFEKGYIVAANYGGNDVKTAEFTARTGIPVAKCDLSNFAQTAAVIAQIESEYGPVEVLVNNAGITRDGTMHRMDFEQCNGVIQTNLASCFTTHNLKIEYRGKCGC